MSYVVKAHHWQSNEQLFEGPLDLLLELIEKEKLDITDVSLAQVADSFLTYLKEVQEISPGNLADFLLVAGKLILIKSKAILPLLELKKEEEEDIEELKMRLKEYKKFKEISKEIKFLAQRKKMFFSRERYVGMKTVFCPPENIFASDLQKAFEDIVENLPKISFMASETIKNVISIKDRIEHIERNLAERMEISFRDATLDIGDKVELIVTFLAMLELVRKNVVVAEQIEMFGEIRIKKIIN